MARRTPVSLLLLIAALAAAHSGCVQRRLAIRSNPPGALVYVDDYPVGLTPISTNFTYYGTRQIRLVKDGYETLTVMQPIPPPWYEIPPLDVVSENLIPGKVRDQRVLDFQLKPQMVVPSAELLGRAESLRRGSQSGTPAPFTAGPPSVRVTPGATGGVPAFPPQNTPELVPTPPGIGGQAVPTLPPR